MKKSSMALGLIVLLGTTSAFAYRGMDHGNGRMNHMSDMDSNRDMDYTSSHRGRGCCDGGGRGNHMSGNRNGRNHMSDMNGRGHMNDMGSMNGSGHMNDMGSMNGSGHMNDMGSMNDSGHRNRQMRSDNLPIAQQTEIAKIDADYNIKAITIESKYDTQYSPLYAERDQLGVQLDNLYGIGATPAEIAKLEVQVMGINAEIRGVREQEKIEMVTLRNDARDSINKIEMDYLNSIQ